MAPAAAVAVPIRFLSETHDSALTRRLDPVVTVVLVERGAGVVTNGSRRYEIRAGNVVMFEPSVKLYYTPIRPLRVTAVTIDEALLLDMVGWMHARTSAPGRARVRSLMTALRTPVLVLHPGCNEFRRMQRLLHSAIGQSSKVTSDPLPTVLLGRLMAFLDPLVLAEHAHDSFAAQLRAAANLTMPEVSHAGVRRALEFLVTRPPVQWSVSALAQHAALAPGHFARVFTAELRCSPRQFLARRRLQEFALLVQSTSLSINQAARRVGWSSTSHAIAAFRGHWGMSPAEYRAAQGRDDGDPAEDAGEA
jgi:AraC-like DNA-binding protein